MKRRFSRDFVLKKRISATVVVGAVVVAAGMFILLIAAIWLFLPSHPTIVAPTPVMAVIPAPTQTPTLSPEALANLTATAQPPSTVGGITVRDFVQVFNTGGGGLNFHSTPSLQSQILFLAKEAEVFEVKDGPKQADDHTWWFLVSSIDHSRGGWAVADYLTLVATPMPH
ncbi:MAG: SH3 domain-containing protein [Anaerolineaceae bacterium]|jgi:hypothetical protein